MRLSGNAIIIMMYFDIYITLSIHDELNILISEITYFSKACCPQQTCSYLFNISLS